MEKERFIRTMVHELKSPLGAVAGSSRWPPTRAWATTLTATCRSGRAEDRIDNLVQLIGDLLSLSRSEQAPEGDEPELVALAPLVEEVAELP